MKKSIILIVLILILSSAGYKLLFKKEEIKEIDVMLFSLNAEKIKGVLASYEKKNNIKINVQEATYLNYTSVLEEQDKKGEDVPDIFVVINDWVGELVEKGLIAEVDPKDLSHIHDKSRKGAEYNGKYYAYPYNNETTFLFYNKDIVKEVPDNIDSLLKLSKDIEKNSSELGISFPTDEYYYHYFWFSYLGGESEDILNMDKKENREKLIKEIKFAKDNFKYSNYYLTSSLFKEGKAAMMINGNWTYEQLKDSKFDYDFKIISNYEASAFMGVKNFAVYKKTKYPEEAGKIAKYLSSYEVQKEMMTNPDFIPANEKALNDCENRAAIEFREKSKYLTLMPNSSNIEGFWLKTNRILNRVFHDDEDVEEVVEEVFNQE